MIKKSFRLMLLVAFALSSVMFVACNKYDDDIERIDGELAALNATVQTLKAAVDGGAVISSVSNTAEGVKFTLSNGQSYVVNHGTVGKDGANGKDGQDGKDGKPGSVVTIGENGNWFIDGVDQGVSAVGASTFVVDCGSYYELNVLEKVEGENAEIVKINLPKTKAITNLDVVKINSGWIGENGHNWVILQMNYGATLEDDLKFNGITYAEGTTLTSGSSKLQVIVNPMEADASLYDFALVDSKGDAPFVVSKIEKNVSVDPLTRADATPNNGVWDMTFTYASNSFDEDDIDDRNWRAYALTTTTYNGTITSGYDVTLQEDKILNPSINVSNLSDSKKRTINLNKAISDLSVVVDYYFEIGDQTKKAAIGAELDGTTLTATTDGTLPMIAHYLLVDGTVGKANFNAVFEYIAPTGDALGSYTWTVQNDNSKTAADETVYYLPISAVKAALIGSADSQMPSVACSAITWADGTALNKKSVVVNGTYYGKAVSGKPAPTTIYASDIATVEATPYVWDATANNKKGAYVVATDINKDLFVKVKFNPQTALVGDYALTLDFKKNGASNVTISVPFNLSIVAPENVIVKNEPYFNGNNAVVYGTANGSVVKADLDDLFTTTGLVYTVTKIKQTSSSTKATYSPWLGTDGAIEVEVKAADKSNANYCVGTTQEFTASKTLFPRVAAATYTFNVTVTSPVVITYTGAAKTINEDPITIAVDEFTGKSLKTGDALYIGKIVADKTYNVDKVGHIKDVTVGVKADDYAKYIKISDNHTTFAEGTVTRKDANGKVVSTVDAVQVERVAGIAQQSPVTCTVNVTVKDLWGVSHVIPVAVTVNPLQ